MATSSRKPTAIDLFAGAGGLSLGLTWAGFDVRAAVDNDSRAVITYRANVGNNMIDRPIQSLKPEMLLAESRLRPGECDLLAAGPPCQGFSVQRRGSRSDPRNLLVLEFLRFVEQVRPKFYVLENVPGLFSKHGVSLMDELRKRTEALGYQVSVAKLDAVHYGVAQFRIRAVVVGERITKGGKSAFLWPKPQLDTRKWLTVRDAIGNLPPPPLDGSTHPDVANHFREANLSSLNHERLRHIPPGGGRECLPEHLQLSCHRNNPSHRHLDVYGRLSWDKPAVTLTARFDSFTRGRYAHPEENRSVTLREGARIQSFPDWFVFHGNREEGARQIGNAVPPKMAEALARQIASALSAYPSVKRGAVRRSA